MSLLSRRPSLGDRSERSAGERERSAVLRHRRAQKQRDGVRIASPGPAPTGSQETQISHLHARSQADAGLAEELQGHRDGPGIHGPVWAAVVESPGGGVWEAAFGESAAYQRTERL